MPPTIHSVIPLIEQAVDQGDFACAFTLLDAHASILVREKSSADWISLWKTVSDQLTPVHTPVAQVAISMARLSCDEPVLLAKMLQRSLDGGSPLLQNEILSLITPQIAAAATAHNQNSMSVPIAIAARQQNTQALVRLLLLNPEVYGAYALLGACASGRSKMAPAVVHALLEVLPNPAPWFKKHLLSFATEDISRSFAALELLPPPLFEDLWLSMTPKEKDQLSAHPPLHAHVHAVTQKTLLTALTESLPASTTEDAGIPSKPHKM